MINIKLLKQYKPEAMEEINNFIERTKDNFSKIKELIKYIEDSSENKDEYINNIYAFCCRIESAYDDMAVAANEIVNTAHLKEGKHE